MQDNEIKTVKYWVSDCGMDTLGPYPGAMSNVEIWDELDSQGHDGSGMIEDWTE